MKPSVYLGGTISGLEYEDITDWRKSLKHILAPEIVCYDPMRGEDYLKGKGIIKDQYPKDNLLASPNGIVTKDVFDIDRSDVGFFYFPKHAAKVSQMSLVELGIFYAQRKPVIWCDLSGLHEHFLWDGMNMILMDTDKKLEQELLFEAIQLLRTLLLP